jgi:hypothetical protein
MVQNGLIPKLRRSQISFQKQTRDGSIFICGYHGSDHNFKLWLRSDTLQSRFDFHSAAKSIEERTHPVESPKLTATWYLLTYPATPESAAEVAEAIISEVANKIS